MSINLSRITRVDITRATRTVSRRSFGTILVAAYHTAWLDRVRSYTDPADMLTDGFTEKHPAYLAVRSAFSQNPRPERVKVGRRDGAPTQTITVTVTEAVDGWEYSITIGGETASYTAGSGDAVADIANGLNTAINGLTVAVTGTDNLDGTLTVAADNPGDWFAYTDIDEKLDVNDDTAEPGTTLATDLGAIDAADANWYRLVVADAQSAPQIEAVAAWVESAETPRVYCGHTMDSDVLTSATDDVASTLKAAEYFRTLPFWSRANHGSFPDAALFAALAPRPGTEFPDADFKSLTGIVADSFTSTEFERLQGTREDPKSGKRATVYVEAVPTGTNSGTPIAMGGVTSGGEWLDVIIGLDWQAALIQERTVNLRLNSDRLPYTEAGIDALESATRGALTTGSEAPYNVLDGDTLSLQATPLEDVSDADKAARFYDGIQWNAAVQGAMRAFNVGGKVRP